jgi:hypothetical protein
MPNYPGWRNRPVTDVSRSNKISEVHQKLTAIGVKVLGAVFTGDRVSAYGKDYCYRDVRDYVNQPAANRESTEPENSQTEAPTA